MAGVATNDYRLAVRRLGDALTEAVQGTGVNGVPRRCDCRHAAAMVQAPALQ